MKPNIKLAEANTPDGALLVLYEHDGNFCIRLDGKELMNSTVATSEILLGDLATKHVANHDKPCVLIGGLGLGFTLRSVLENGGPEVSVHVAELMPAVVAWNREFLSGLNGKLLDDPRVHLFVEDVWHVIARGGRAKYDAILLDIDNGPFAMVQKENSRMYESSGLERISASLKPGGRVAIWSACPDHGFADRLTEVGFHVEIVRAKLFDTAKRCAYTIFVADK
ncbi:MAG: spermine synthase [Verrucomicrobiales bacterium]|nr:spermine synthase [Verrucomicrobiales bacterium]